MQVIKLRLVLEWLDKIDRRLAKLNQVAERRRHEDDAPAHYSVREAQAWARGWNACMKEMRQALRNPVRH